MNNQNAQLLLENFIERIERDPETGLLRLRGAVTENEFESLRIALDLLAGGRSRVQLGEQEPRGHLRTEGPTESSSFVLNLASTNREALDGDGLLCLDFGTAMSKAVATQEGREKRIPLSLGEQSGEPGTVFPVSSTLYIGCDGFVYFGREAVEKNLAEQDARRLRFDSPKQHMSQGRLDDVLDRVVRDEINPTGIAFTVGDLIIVYLAFLTDLACAELEQRGMSRYVRRRYARPRWQDDRANWSDQKMTEMLAKAQILADTFSGQWTGGIEATTMRRALDAVCKRGNLPEYLVVGGVLEAVAAASGSLPRGIGKRRLYMVVDVGAGTTDYGLFAVVMPKGGNSKPKVFGVRGTDVTLRQAGDRIDDILLKYILDESNVLPGSPQYDHVVAHLRRHIRFWKEGLFRDGEVRYNLPDDTNGEVKVEDFVKCSPFLALQGNFEAYFRKSLENAHTSWLEGFSENGRLELTVVLTGGGAKLPMAKALGEGGLRVGDISVIRRPAENVPKWFVDDYPGVEGEYPQLAVSIGGAADSLPVEGPQYEEFGFTRKQITARTEYKR